MRARTTPISKARISRSQYLIKLVFGWFVARSRSILIVCSRILSCKLCSWRRYRRRPTRPARYVARRGIASPACCAPGAAKAWCGRWSSTRPPRPVASLPDLASRHRRPPRAAACDFRGGDRARDDDHERRSTLIVLAYIHPIIGGLMVNLMASRTGRLGGCDGGRCESHHRSLGEWDQLTFRSYGRGRRRRDSWVRPNTCA